MLSDHTLFATSHAHYEVNYHIKPDVFDAQRNKHVFIGQINTRPYADFLSIAIKEDTLHIHASTNHPKKMNAALEGFRSRSIEVQYTSAEEIEIDQLAYLALSLRCHQGDAQVETYLKAINDFIFTGHIEKHMPMLNTLTGINATTNPPSL